MRGRAPGRLPGPQGVRTKRRRPPLDPSNSPAAYARALRLLTARAYGRVELARALEARGYARAAVTGALDRLNREGWLDDLAAARAAARSRARRYGRARIERELSVRGFSRETIAAVLGEREASEESETLAGVFHRLERAHARLPPEKRRQKIRSALLRRGFAADEVSEIMKGSDEVERGSGEIP